MYGLYKFVVL